MPDARIPMRRRRARRTQPYRERDVEPGTRDGFGPSSGCRALQFLERRQAGPSTAKKPGEHFLLSECLFGDPALEKRQETETEKEQTEKDKRKKESSLHFLV